MTGPRVPDPINRNWDKPVARPKNTDTEVWWLSGRYRFMNRRAPYVHNRGDYAPYETLEHWLQVTKATADDRPRAANMRLHRELRHSFRNGILTEREDWHASRDKLMWEALCHRFSLQSPYPELRIQLMDTYPDISLIADSNVGCENHWGICFCPTCGGSAGSNVYGYYLLEVRKLLLNGRLK
jgi:predicted NAD-dependent protein-ADP-ribosyltransferase YbiA (DUF1768 family)